MRESVIEKQLAAQARKLGAIPMKFLAPGFNGVPDRLLAFPGGVAVFVEVKAPGERPRKQQAYRIRQLRKLGFTVEVVSSMEDVDRVMEHMRLRLEGGEHGHTTKA